MNNARRAMPHLQIHPHVGVGPVRFGMSAREVELAVGYPPKRLPARGYNLARDLFEKDGLMVNYDETGVVNAIGIARLPAVALEYEGFDLFGGSARRVREWALERDGALDPTDGFTSIALGLNMWSDWIDQKDLGPVEREDPASSFLVFRPGYYEQERARLGKAALGE